MRSFSQIFAVGAVLASLLPAPAAIARSQHGATSAYPSYASRYTAQYDGPAYGPGADGPQAGYGPYGPGYGGGYGPGYGGGYGPGYGRGYGPGYGGGYGPGYRGGYGPGYGPGYGQRGAYRGDPSMRPAPWGHAGGSFAYRGFRVRPAYSASTAEGARQLAAARYQIEIVRRAGLSGSALRLFRRQPIDFGRSAHFTGGDVVLGRVQAGDSRPILLHEFMHLYHRDRLPGGFANPTIRGFFEQARANNLYPQGSYMMSNVREFFAMTSSCFLNGTVARPPFTREAIRAAQPAYYAYLAQLFGRGG